MRNASDRIDADEMSKRLRDDSLKPVFHGEPEMLTLIPELMIDVAPDSSRHVEALV